MQARETVNDMLRELQEDMTLGHLRENWFNATSPCMEVEMRGERGEGDETKRLYVYARLDFSNSRKQLSCEFN